MAEQLFDPEFLNQLEQLRLHFRHKAAGQSGGGRQSKQLGVSSEFSDFREYQLGDDFRRVDWNAYARFGRLILKLFMEERQMQFHMLIDNSASMQMYGKALMAKRLALTMGYLALSSYDQMSITPLGETPGESFGPVTGKASFMRAAGYLEDMPVSPRTKLYDSITRLRFGSGSGICYVFTDGFSDDSLSDALGYLRYYKQKTTLVHILGPEEIRPGLEGEVRLLDTETGEQREVEMSPGLLRAYEEALRDFTAGLREACHKHGFAYEQISSGMDLRQAVLEQLIISNN